MSDHQFHPDALSDLDALWDYIAVDNVDAADRVVDEIFATIRTLARAPGIGHRRPI
jgi:plasmid stabilization system protein ParE